MALKRSAARALGSVLGRIKREWESLDQAAQLFPEREDFHRWYLQTRERNTEVKRAQMKAYARTNILPRVKFGTGFIPQLQMPANTGGLSPRNRDILDNAVILLASLLIASFTFYLYYTGVGRQGVGLLDAVRMPALGMDGMSMAPPMVARVETPATLAPVTSAAAPQSDTGGDVGAPSRETVEVMKARLASLERRLADLTIAMATTAAEAATHSAQQAHPDLRQDEGTTAQQPARAQAPSESAEATIAAQQDQSCHTLDNTPTAAASATAALVAAEPQSDGGDTSRHSA